MHPKDTPMHAADHAYSVSLVIVAPIVHDFRRTIEIGTGHSRHQFKIIGIKRIETFINIKCLYVLSCRSRIRADRQHLIIIRIHGENLSMAPSNFSISLVAMYTFTRL